MSELQPYHYAGSIDLILEDGELSYSIDIPDHEHLLEMLTDPKSAERLDGKTIYFIVDLRSLLEN